MATHLERPSRFVRIVASTAPFAASDPAAVGRLLETLARLGADPDVPCADGVTPRQVAETLRIPVTW